MCTRPVTIHIPVSDKHFSLSRSASYQVPCGHCAECKKRYQNDWKIRLFEQYRDSKVAVFFTLTYAPENVPIMVDTETGEFHQTVFKKHVQDWLKRMRTDLTRYGVNHPLSHTQYDSKTFKYFITSEYGPRTFRPHYHGIILGLDYYACKRYFDDWRSKFGFVSASNVKSASNSAAYVAKYCSKGVFECPLVSQNKVLPTFHLISKGIGEGYVKRMKSFHLTSPFFNTPRRVNWYYSKKYLEFVADNLVYQHPAFVYGGKPIKYHLPKFYVTRILQHQVVLKKISNEGKESTFKAFRQTALSRQLADFLFKRNVEVRDNECRALQDQFGFKSYGEALALQSKNEAWLLADRERGARDSLERFYNKAKL